MTPRRTAIGSLSRLRILRNDAWRRVATAVIVIVCAILTFFPQSYRAAVTLTPADPATLGLSGTLMQQGAVGNLFGSALGSQTAIETSLTIANSTYVRAYVARRVGLERRLGKDAIGVQRWLAWHVDIRSLRGAIVQVSLKNRDPEFALAVVNAYSEALRRQLATISETQTTLKRQILEDLVGSASDRLARAQSAYDTFRLRNRYADPQSGLFSTAARVPDIESQLRSKQIELQVLQRFGTAQNVRVRQTIAEIAALQGQLNGIVSQSGGSNGTVGNVVTQTTQLDRLYRELLISKSLYDSYRLFLQGTRVEDLTASANVRVLEPPYLDPARQFNTLALALGATILLIELAIEFYKLRPPLASVRDDGVAVR